MNQMTASYSALKPSHKNGKITWPHAPSVKQQLSLPSSVIYYISKNPSTPEIYLKLAMSCKYFFEKNPLLIIKRIRSGGRYFCSNEEAECYYANRKCCINIDIAKINSKIWLTGQFELFYNNILPSFALLLPSKLYQCENAVLSVSYSELTFSEFKLLASKFQKFDLYNIKLFKHGNDLVVDEILELIPNVKEITYWFNLNAPTATSSTMKNILKLNNLTNLLQFSLYNMTEIINVDDLAIFIKDHKDTKLYFYFGHVLSAEYKKQLDALIDAVIDSNVFNCVIDYSGQDYEKLKIMRSRNQ